MHDGLALLIACASGLVLGAMFFGGLWWTVRLGLSSAQPAVWLLASALVRTGLALAGFYLIGRSDWQRLLAALVGFIGARFVVMWHTRDLGMHARGPGKSHAS